MTEITPLLLAGGSGSRLWPLSRGSYPKQFAPLIDNITLFQQGAKRLIGTNTINFSKMITITNSDFRFIVSQQLDSIGVDPGLILIEPEAKNTAPAVLAASIIAYRKNAESTILCTPSDHLIPNVEQFHQAVSDGLDYAKQELFVTFGVPPTRPDTGYGYLELSEAPKKKGTKLNRFIEKPKLEEARKMFTAGNFYWNTGIFLFKSKTMIEAFKKHQPKMLDYVKSSLDQGTYDLGFYRLNPDIWSLCEDVSIDYAIMEKVDNIFAIPFKGKWSDLGNWEAIWEEMPKDSNGVALSSNAHAVECQNSLLRSENENQEIVGLGLKDIVAVAMPDAVLVAKKNSVQDVKKVVSVLQEKNIFQSNQFPKENRPWGWFEQIALGDRFKVKRIKVNPGASLSLQSHKYRSEHWVVVEGIAEVLIDGKKTHLKEGQSTYIPLGVTHRLSNTSEDPMLLIEVQIGSYLEEDDITRYDDIYAREVEAKI